MFVISVKNLWPVWPLDTLLNLNLYMIYDSYACSYTPTW
jgi:hypothetical protein